MFYYPHINPVAISLGRIQIHWYGIMYLLGFWSAWLLGSYRIKKMNGIWSKEQLSDLIFYCALGVILGGRIGYMLFYNWPNFYAEPLSLFKVWQGGMSFHGGCLGVIIAMWCYAYFHKRTFFSVSDFIAPLVPCGLAFGRIGNFINGELWGRITTVPWGMIYPQAGSLPRHPSQIYEFLMEGILLFIIVWIYSSKPRPQMAVSGLFAFCYGIFRFIAECFRQPDPQLGYIAFHWLTMGQLLSLPLIFLGMGLLIYSYISKENHAN